MTGILWKSYLANLYSPQLYCGLNPVNCSFFLFFRMPVSIFEAATLYHSGPTATGVQSILWFSLSESAVSSISACFFSSCNTVVPWQPADHRVWCSSTNYRWNKNWQYHHLNDSIWWRLHGWQVPSRELLLSGSGGWQQLHCSKQQFATWILIRWLHWLPTLYELYLCGGQH